MLEEEIQKLETPLKCKYSDHWHPRGRRATCWGHYEKDNSIKLSKFWGRHRYLSITRTSNTHNHRCPSP